MSFNLFICKGLTRQIENYKCRRDKLKLSINKYNKWIKVNENEINKRLKRLSRIEYLIYGYSVGFIEEADYQVMVEQLKNKEGEPDGKAFNKKIE